MTEGAVLGLLWHSLLALGMPDRCVALRNQALRDGGTVNFAALYRITRLHLYLKSHGARIGPWGGLIPRPPRPDPCTVTFQVEVKPRL